MKKHELNLLYNYIYNNRYRLENEVRQLQQNIRYRPVDVIDCSELACAIERLNTFKQTTKDIMKLLSLSEIDILEHDDEII